MVIPHDSYDESFQDLLEEKGFIDRRNVINIFSKPMRTGKDWSEVNFRIPILFELFPQIKLHIATTPDTCIISDWEWEYKELCRRNQWSYETEPRKIIRSLESGNRVVALVTNQKAFVKGMQELYEYCKKHNLFSFISVSADEFHTWSLSYWENANSVKGWNTTKTQYKHVMYNFLTEVASQSPFMFAKTATANREVTGEVETVGQLKYNHINPLVAGEQKQYVNRVGWLGDVYYYQETTELPIDDSYNLPSKNELWITCLTNIKNDSAEVNTKKVILVPCAVDKRGYSYVDEFIKDNITSNADIISSEDSEEVGFVMTSDQKNTYSFNRHGNKVDENVSIDDIFVRINDMNDSTFILIVKNMAARGVSIPPCGAVFFAKTVEREGDAGIVTEAWEQIFGRGKSVFLGLLTSVFWTKWDGNLSKVMSEKSGLSARQVRVLNTYDIYGPNSPTMKESVESHKTYDACTWDMLPDEIKQLGEVCPVCKRPFPKVEENIEELESFVDEHDPCYYEEGVEVV